MYIFCFLCLSVSCIKWLNTTNDEDEAQFGHAHKKRLQSLLRVSLLLVVFHVIYNVFFSTTLHVHKFTVWKSFSVNIQSTRKHFTCLRACSPILNVHQPSFLGHATKVKIVFEILRKYNIYVNCNHSRHWHGLWPLDWDCVDADHCV